MLKVGGVCMQFILRPIIVIFIFLFTPMSAFAYSQESESITLDNGQVVEVFYEGASDGYSYEVEFANGHSYFYNLTGNTGTGGGSAELTQEEMELAEEAIDKFEEQYGKAASTSNGSGSLIGLLLIFIGLVGAIFPQAIWFLSIGWRLRDAEPSNLALGVYRFGGIVVTIIGVFALF